MTTKELVREALEILRTYSVSPEAGAGVLAPGEVEPLERLVQESVYHDPHLPRIVLLGEFNSGKSSLLNALVGQRIAATDVLEMTSWIARYWPSEEPFCRIRRTDGSTDHTTLKRFLTRCEQRDFSAQELSTIDSVDVGVTHVDFRAAFVDTPGIGSITRENEIRLVRALDEADLVAWILDIESIGSIREASIIRRLREQGFPIIVVLTKCDLLETTEEAEEIVAYVNETYAIPRDLVFLTSARACSSDVSQLVERPPAGVAALREHIAERIAPRRSALRQAAAEAHDRRVAEHACRLLERVVEKLRGARERVEHFARITDHLRESVQLQMEAELESYVDKSMFAEKRSDLVRELTAKLREGKKAALSESAVTEVFRSTLGESYFDRFWQDLLTEIRTVGPKLWVNRLEHQIKDIEELLEGFEADSWDNIRLDFSPEEIEARVESEANEVIRTGITTTLGLAGAATAYAAAFSTVTTTAVVGVTAAGAPIVGTVATNMGLAAALSGVGIPIAAIGSAVTGLLYLWRKNNAKKAMAAAAGEVLDRYKEEFVTRMLRPFAYPKLRHMNRMIQAALVDNLRNSVCARLPGCNLEDMEREAAALHRRLARIHTGGMQAGVAGTAEPLERPATKNPLQLPGRSKEEGR